MPELPEVETIKSELEGKIINKKIINVWIEPSFEKKIKPDDFTSILIKKRIQKINRKGKLIYIQILPTLFLLIHLKMTGQLVFVPNKGNIIVGGHPIISATDLPNKFSRAIFTFNNQTKLYFNDVRKFGYLKLVNDLELDNILQKFGPEPIAKDFTTEYFDSLTKRFPEKKIKQLLLEQPFISGIGNIYADEICFFSKVLPIRKCKSLNIEEKKNLVKNSSKILNKAIKFKGTTFSNYVNSEGKSGGFQKHLYVYGRAGEICKKCKQTQISKSKVVGRGTHFCLTCQC